MISNAYKVEFDNLFNLDITGDVTEYKVDKLPAQQITNAMACTAGKLLAKVLIEGKHVYKINMYGLAFNHDCCSLL